MKKRILSILLAISIAVGAMGTAAAVYTTQINVDPDISVTMGGKDVALEDVNGKAVDPMYIDGTIYLPIRAISETVGYDVQWDGGTKTVVIGEPVEVGVGGGQLHVRALRQGGSLLHLPCQLHPVRDEPDCGRFPVQPLCV